MHTFQPELYLWLLVVKYFIHNAIQFQTFNHPHSEMGVVQ